MNLNEFKKAIKKVFSDNKEFAFKVDGKRRVLCFQDNSVKLRNISRRGKVIASFSKEDINSQFAQNVFNWLYDEEYFDKVHAKRMNQYYNQVS